MPSSSVRRAWAAPRCGVARPVLVTSVLVKSVLALPVLARAALAICAAAWPMAAHAQTDAKGFAVERLYQSAPGSGFLAMDDLRLHGGLGGALSLTVGYAHAPLQVDAGGPAPLAVVRHQTFANIAAAVTWDRFRLHMTFASPLYVAGESGARGAFQFTAPKANVEQNPDTVSDVTAGLDARLLGEWDGPFRLGAGAQLILPSGDRADYGSDGTYRAMGRLLVAGDVGRISYAGHLGAHLRPLDDAGVPGSPRGSELLFGIAAVTAVPVGPHALLVGPELYGASAFRALLGSETTALEGLLSARLDGPRKNGSQVRLKLGVGGGIHPRFGAPEWRVVCGIEIVGQTGDWR